MPTHTTPVRQRTRLLFRTHGISLLMATVASLVACQPSTSTPIADKTMKSEKQQVVYLDVNLKSYLDHPIFDVYLNGVDIGVAGGPPHGGNGGLISGVAVPTGPQTVTWRNAGTGATTTAANQPVLGRPDAKLTYLGVHIYPDNTVELIPSSHWPEASERGEAINQAWKRDHGQ
jgi:hypothetical protein